MRDRGAFGWAVQDDAERTVRVEAPEEAGARTGSGLAAQTGARPAQIGGFRLSPPAGGPVVEPARSGPALEFGDRPWGAI
jgi:hypothetical protein